MAIWHIVKEEADIKLMTKTLNIDEITAQILVNRGIRTKNTAIKYLNPRLEFQHDEGQLKDMQKAAEILEGHIKNDSKIVIYGDYDVDGVVSTVILHKTIKYLGGSVAYYIPAREEEGYGLNKSAILNLKEQGADLIIACDNGAAAASEVAYAKSLGLDVIIIDHHELEFDENGSIFPPADAFINPKRPDCEYPFKLMCAGGLCYKFSKYFHNHMGADFVLHDEALMLAMLSTFCDIVDLLEENRVFVRNGLDILNRNKQINKGLFALLRERNIDDKDITEFHVGFIIGPCINATGRLDLAESAARLLLTESDEEAKELAARLAMLNEERKALTNGQTNAVIEALKDYPLEKIIVFYHEEIHESIAGIIAGRIKERMYRPTIILTKSNDFVKGSGRSIEGYNMQQELNFVKDLLLKFGGHPMAAGLTMKLENVVELRQRLNESCALSGDDFTEKIDIDHKLEFDEITFTLAKNIDIMSPFGKANKQPFFVTYSLKILSIKVIEAKNTVIFTLSDLNEKQRIKAILFGDVDAFREKLQSIFGEYESQKIMAGILRHTALCMDVVYNIDINEFNGDVSVQMKIKDYNLYEG